jgi:hypothetical protein
MTGAGTPAYRFSETEFLSPRQCGHGSPPHILYLFYGQFYVIQQLVRHERIRY